MGAVYIILYGLIPKFLERNKVLKFLGFSVLVVIVMTIIQVFFHKAYLSFFFGREFFTSNILLFIFIGVIDMGTVAVCFVTFSFLGSIYRKDRLNKLLEKEKLQTELNFLKSQTSPHFLFNALNSIYVLIDIDQRKAREILLKFSALLRYQLYECNETVYLSRELEFLECYIELERIRKKKLEVIYNRPDDIPTFEIIPFLLIPLLENAFKHVSHSVNKTDFVHIHIHASEIKLEVEIINSREEISESPQVGGIGIQNIERRLKLLYPERHQFFIIKEPETFKINLILYADKNKLHHR